MKELLAYTNPKGSLPTLKGQGNLLIVGGAACVWEDLRWAGSQNWDSVMAVNDIANYLDGPIHHITSCHPEKMPFFSFKNPEAETHAHYPGPGVKHVWPLMRDGGTSGLFGIFVGLLMGFERIVLAGIPCDGQGRFFESQDKPHNLFGLDIAFQEWERAFHICQGRVKSLSGRTRQLLGSP